MVRFLTDEDFNGRIVRGLFLRQSDLDLVRVQEIEAELRRFHRHLRPQPRGFHLVDHGQIVLSHLLRLVHAGEVLAELRKDGADALHLLLLRRRHRIVEPFARHECRDGATDEGGPRRPLAKPAVGGER